MYTDSRLFAGASDWESLCWLVICTLGVSYLSTRSWTLLPDTKHWLPCKMRRGSWLLLGSSLCSALLQPVLSTSLLNEGGDGTRQRALDSSDPPPTPLCRAQFVVDTDKHCHIPALTFPAELESLFLEPKEFFGNASCCAWLPDLLVQNSLLLLKIKPEIESTSPWYL